jgi:hypothetical protein
MVTVNPSRTIAELKELRALTADENGAQRIAWTDTWLKARANRGVDFREMILH